MDRDQMPQITFDDSLFPLNCLRLAAITRTHRTALSSSCALSSRLRWGSLSSLLLIHKTYRYSSTRKRDADGN